MRGPARCVMEPALHVQSGQTCSCQKGRGAARESGLSRSRRNAMKRKRSDDVHSKNGHEQVSIQPI